MTAFADSSALVKLYVPEVGFESIRHRPVLAVSQLARVEVPSALWGKQRGGELDVSDARLLVSAFEADYAGAPGSATDLVVVQVREPVLRLAASLTARHRLRAYDAVQLASAALVRHADPTVDEFLAFDEHLRTAAAIEGFSVARSPH